MNFFRNALAAVILVLFALPAGAAEPTTLAVLPFTDESPDQSREYFSHGMSEELRKASSRVEDLQVAGVDSSNVIEASLYAQQDRPKQAMAALRRATDRGWKDYAVSQQDLRFSPLRDHPEFRRLLSALRQDAARLRAAALPPLS